MNRVKLIMNRNFFNSKLNREKFQINKIKTNINKTKINKTNTILNNNKFNQMVKVRYYHTYHSQNSGDNGPDWRMLFLSAALAFYTINRFMKK
jgi:hypothetical protein